MMTELEADLAALADTLRASSVAIRSARGGGSGSGVIWSADGTIVTNAHVAPAADVDVELPDGRRLRGRVARRDEARDLAEVRIAADGLTAARYRAPADLRVGEFVAAFGHPLGVAHVLSTGIVYARHHAGGDRFVRADVRLAPGNSGGALADAAGRVVGINSMVAGGLALAIPSDDVRRFIGESLPAPRLGVRLAAAQLSGGRRAFAVIAIEPGSRAERSGLGVGDIIVARNVGRLAGARSVEVLRGGEPVAIPIAGPQSEAAAAA